MSYILRSVSFDFDGDELDVVSDRGELLLVIRRVCEAVGVRFHGQLEKLKSDPSICVQMICMQMPGDDQVREIACIDIRSLPLWLATIHPSKVRPELREKLVRYKRECAEVLAMHFLGSRGGSEEHILRVENENMVLRAKLEVFARTKPGVIGPDRANNILLPHLREAARIACATDGDMSANALRREFMDRENQLRLHVGFPRSTAQSWENLPLVKFGDAFSKVMEIKARDTKRARRIMKLAIDAQLKLKLN